MKEKIEKFLNSSLLEEYVLGTISPDKVGQVEEMIRSHDEVKLAYDELQDNLERLATMVSSAPPEGMKKAILKRIDQNIVVTKTDAKPSKNILSILACIFGLMGLFVSLLFYTQNTKLKNQIEVLDKQFVELKNDCEENQMALAAQEQQRNVLTDINTFRFKLEGNQKAADFQTLAFVNRASQIAYLNILKLPTIPSTKCLQLWADVDGEMVSVAVLPTQAAQIISIPFKEGATSLNVTIESAGGSDHATVENLIASVSI